MTDLNHILRTKHANHIPYAAANVARACGYKVTFERPMRSRYGRRKIYRIEGVDAPCVGVHALREKLWELGVQLSVSAMANRLADHPEPWHFGEYRVRCEGVTADGVTPAWFGKGAE